MVTMMPMMNMTAMIMTWDMKQFIMRWLMAPNMDNMTMVVMNIVMPILTERIMTLMTRTPKMRAHTMLIMTMMPMQTSVLMQVINMDVDTS